MTARRIMSWRCADRDQAHTAPGSIPLPCIVCRHDTWASPASIQAIVIGAELICIRCLPPDALDHGVEFLPGTLEELELKEGPVARKVVEQGIEHFNRTVRHGRRSR